MAAQYTGRKIRQPKLVCPKILSGKCVFLLLTGVKEVGSFQPQEVLPLFEHLLTWKEFLVMEKFLKWVLNAQVTFNTRNINHVYSHFLNGTIP